MQTMKHKIKVKDTLWGNSKSQRKIIKQQAEQKRLEKEQLENGYKWVKCENRGKKLVKV